MNYFGEDGPKKARSGESDPFGRSSWLLPTKTGNGGKRGDTLFMNICAPLALNPYLFRLRFSSYFKHFAAVNN